MEIKAFFVPSRDDTDADHKLFVSKVKTFDSCAAKFKYNYIEKLPKKEWDFHVFGTFCHDTLEYFHKKLIKKGKEIKLDEGDNKDALQVNDWAPLMKETFQESIEKFKEKLTHEQKQEAFGILQGYLDSMKEQRDSGELPDVTEVEREFYIEINERVLLNGFIDRVQIDPDGVLHVADYKTTKNKKYLDDFFQLETYAYVLFLADPKLEKVRASFMCLRHNFDLLTKEFTRKDVEHIATKFLNYAQKIDDEQLFRPQPQFLCKYCDFLEHCHQGERYLIKRGIIDDSDVNKSFGLETW